MSRRPALVYGLAVAGESTVVALQRHGHDVIVADDAVTPERAATAARLDVELLDSPGPDEIEALVARCDIVSPSPGIPETHAVIGAARAAGCDIASEIELAYRWERERSAGPRPMLAVTGTDGKTTTTLMAAHMLREAGHETIDAGNTDTPLVTAVADDSYDAFVVECASFRLAWTPSFRAEAAVWLNLAPDHLNWHRSMETYEDAKFQVWANQRDDDTAIGYAADAAVMRRLGSAPGRRRTFGTDDADYRLEREMLIGPNGPIASRSSMRRSLPHDVTDALAAAALVLESGLADESAIQRALSTFVGPPHRLEHVGRWKGIDWYNDSKATTPHAAAVAIHAFDDIVLIAGGKDKHVDLAEMAVESERVRAVVAIGETREAIARAFSAVPVVETATSLSQAVELAADLVIEGQTVLLSPGCASLDQFVSFEARGDLFKQLVRERHATPSHSPLHPMTTGTD